MRARLQRFLPVILIALAMQVLAPIAACWAAGMAAADPLQATAICHSADRTGAGLDDHTGAPGAHTGTCALCCTAEASASFDTPQATLSLPIRHAECVVWHDPDSSLVVHRGGSNVQARAPPHLM